jgi:hypothetical protein
MLLAALLGYFFLFSNSPKKVKLASGPAFLMRSLDDPDQDSLISFDMAMSMRKRYLDDPRKFRFRYHDKPVADSNSIVEANLEGMLFNASTIQAIINKTKCNKLYVMFGLNYQKRKNAPSITDTFLTTILVPVKGAAGDYTYMTSESAGEYSSPCPPYCPH